MIQFTIEDNINSDGKVYNQSMGKHKYSSMNHNK